MTKRCILLVIALIVAIFASGCSDDTSSAAPSEEINQTNQSLEEPQEDLSIDPLYFDNNSYNKNISQDIQAEGLHTFVNLSTLTDDQLAELEFPDVSNDDATFCEGTLTANGSVQLDRFNDTPLPNFIASVTLQPANVTKPVKFDYFTVHFSNGINTSSDRIIDASERKGWIGTVKTIKKAGENYTESSSIILQPGENISFSVDSVNWLNNLLVNSSTGNILLTIAAYNETSDGNYRVGVFHAALPRVYEINGMPAEIKVGEEQPLFFESYPEAGKKVDADFYKHNSYYARSNGMTGDVSDEAKEVHSEDAGYQVLIDPVDNQISALGKVTASGQNYIIHLDLTGIETASFNQTQIVIENGNGNGLTAAISHIGIENGETYPLTIVAGQTEPLELTVSSDKIADIASKSNKGNIAIHIAMFNGGADYGHAVACFHAVLPTGIIQSGGEKNLIWENFNNVESQIS